MKGYNLNTIAVFCSILPAFLLMTVTPAAAETPQRVSSPVSTVVRADAKTGRLVRRVVSHRPAGASSLRTVPPSVADVVEKSAARHDVDPLLVHSMISVESAYNTQAVSPKGAQGLMQLIPQTAQRFGVDNPFDAEQNIEGGVKYLKYLREMFKDDRLALAAYNAGEGAVMRHKGIPPYRETQQYVELVGKRYEQARRKDEAHKQAAAPPPAPGEEPLRSLEVEVDAEGRLLLKTR